LQAVRDKLERQLPLANNSGLPRHQSNCSPIYDFAVKPIKISALGAGLETPNTGGNCQQATPITMQIMSPLMCGGGQTVDALPLLLFKGDLALLLQGEGLLRESREQEQQSSH